MVDFLGQELKAGDLVVIKIPYGQDLALGRVKKVNSSSVSVYYIPNYTMANATTTDKELLVDTLLSPEFSGEEVLKLHNNYGNEYNFSYNKTTRTLYTVVKITKKQAENFVDRWLSFE